MVKISLTVDVKNICNLPSGDMSKYKYDSDSLYSELLMNDNQIYEIDVNTVNQRINQQPELLTCADGYQKIYPNSRLLLSSNGHDSELQVISVSTCSEGDANPECTISEPLETCEPIVCMTPTGDNINVVNGNSPNEKIITLLDGGVSTNKYLVTETNRDLSSGFDVTIECSPGYEGGFVSEQGIQVTQCIQNGSPYILPDATQCTKITCNSKLPSGVNGYNIQETQLDLDGFDVVVNCAPGYEGTAIVSQCDSTNLEYNITGCQQLYCSRPNVLPDGYIYYNQINEGVLDVLSTGIIVDNTPMTCNDDICNRWDDIQCNPNTHCQQNPNIIGTCIENDYSIPRSDISCSVNDPVYSINTNSNSKCIPIVCNSKFTDGTTEGSVNGYNVKEIELDKSADGGFQVEVESCAEGYEQTQQNILVSPCTYTNSDSSPGSNGNYTLSGCEPIVCDNYQILPEGYKFKDGTTQQLDLSEVGGFQVEVQCKYGYGQNEKYCRTPEQVINGTKGIQCTSDDQCSDGSTCQSFVSTLENPVNAEVIPCTTLGQKYNLIGCEKIDCFLPANLDNDDYECFREENGIYIKKECNLLENGCFDSNRTTYNGHIVEEGDSCNYLHNVEDGITLNCDVNNGWVWSIHNVSPEIDKTPCPIDGYFDINNECSKVLCNTPTDFDNYKVERCVRDGKQIII